MNNFDLYAQSRNLSPWSQEHFEALSAWNAALKALEARLDYIVSWTPDLEDLKQLLKELEA